MQGRQVMPRDEAAQDIAPSEESAGRIRKASAALLDAPALLRRRLLKVLGAGTAALVAAGQGTALAQKAREEPGTRLPTASSRAGGTWLPWVSADAGRDSLIDDLVTGYHILFREAIVDAFGHISTRNPANPAHYLMARTVQPPFVAAEDIVEVDANSAPVISGAPAVPFERFIHGEIYRTRPDVNAIVHSHAAAVLPFTVAKDAPLRALCHTCGFIGAGAPIFEIRDFAGDGSNMLVDSGSLGEKLASTLGHNTIVLMRGHGFTVVGRSIQEAVYNAINTV
ncbi:MAG: class II aldolase/adducin family protein, partial [Gammaproteobacteria bacterium]|nr:class II aldolase/adducin family protein [Gammaproteobacteria bacterium]